MSPEVREMYVRWRRERLREAQFILELFEEVLVDRDAVLAPPA